MTDVDLGWQDVLRRAERRRVTPRVLVIAVAVAAVATAAPAMGVLLTRPGPPQLPADQITGPVSTVAVQNGIVLVRVQGARWNNHDGICYLVPHVRAGCLLRGEQSRRLIAIPTLYRLREQVRTHKRWVVRRPVAFHVVALPGGKAKVVSG